MRPERFDASTDSPDAAKTWNHWKRTFDNFISSVGDQNPDKLSLLTNFVAPYVYEHIAESTTYGLAISTLTALYVKPRNEIFARHVLATARQEPGQSLDQFLQRLKTIAKDCNFKMVTAEVNRDYHILDAFICGLMSNQIRQRLLEDRTLGLQTAYDRACALEMAEMQSQTYSNIPSTLCSSLTTNADAEENEPCTAVAAITNSKCFFCGFQRHPRSKCPAREAICKLCGKKGHYQSVCQSGQRNKAKR